MATTEPLPAFRDMGLAPPLLEALQEVGYEAPTHIQAECIPALLDGHDLLGQAQTGTGKTAAFALPLLSRLDMTRRDPQVLVLTPTRELAIQVAEAFQRYARHLQDFHVLPIYGGQSYDIQLRQLKRGAQVVVGTPGRVMDHMRRGTLKLAALQALVLDEADEMLRMGFIDDVQWVLEHTPDTRQIALFSATMPREIAHLAKETLKRPQTVKVGQTAAADTVSHALYPVEAHLKTAMLMELLFGDGGRIQAPLYREGLEGAPKMLSIGLHCRLVGRPGRAAALKRALDYMGLTPGTPLDEIKIGGMGASRRRVEDNRFIRGRGNYVDDVVLADALEYPFFRTGSCAGEITPVSGRECVDIQWLDPQFLAGAIPQNVQDYLFDVDRGNTEYTQWAVEGFISGEVFDMPAGAAAVAIGFHNMNPVMVMITVPQTTAQYSSFSSQVKRPCLGGTSLLLTM